MCSALQLDNGLEALLIYDPASDPDSHVRELMRERLAFSSSAQQREQAMDEFTPASESTIHILVNTGMFSNPEDLQVRVVFL
jgi:hypothetical protein